MKTGKNELATLSPQQSNPYTAMPEDFEIIRDGDKVFHGQRSDKLQKQSETESKRKPAKHTPAPATEPGDASAPRTPGIGSDE